MNDRNRRTTPVTVLCVAVMLGVGFSVVAASQGAQDEQALIGVLKGNAGWQEKQAACRVLRVKGTAASVPALAALLPDEKLSHLARFALEPMPYPEAGQALRDALGKTNGLLKCGVVTSLGVRRDAGAVALLAPLLKDGNADVACATAGALGRIASPDAVKALLDFRTAAPEPVRPTLAEGLLAAGDRLRQDKNGDGAAVVYKEMLASTWPTHVRMGAFRGLTFAQPKQAPQLLIEALGGKDPMLCGLAADLVAETSGADTTKLYADALPKLPASGQVALVAALALRKDVAARPGIVQAVASPDKQVKLAAMKALSVLGTVGDVPALTGLLASDDADVANAAAASLEAMEAEGVDAALAAALPKAAPAVRVRLFTLLANRRAEQAMPLALAGLKDADASVRNAGLAVLALMGTKEQAPLVMDVVVRATDATERGNAEEALSNICSRNSDAVVPIVLEGMKGGAIESRLVLMRVLARAGGPKALEGVVAAMKDPNAQIADEAVRLLCDWPTLDAGPHVLELAQSSDANRQVVGLRGYIRLAGMAPSPPERAKMLTMAMELAKGADEKKLILGTWGTLVAEDDVNPGQALDALLPHLDDAAVQNEAATAIVTAAARLAQKVPTSKAKSADVLKAVVEKCKDAGINDRAQKALAALQ